jgi:hypothetical protein
MGYRWWQGTDQKMFKAKYLNFGNGEKPYVNRQVRTDRILDKISRTGYDSLTPEEKDFLDNQGRYR